MVTVALALFVPTVTDPKLTAEGVAPTPAKAGTGKSMEPIKKIPTNEDTNSVLAILVRPFAYDL